MEKLYKMGPSPQQVQADLSEQSRSRADLTGNAGVFPTRFGREAGTNNTRVQRCRMPAFAFTPPPRAVHGIRAAPTFPEPAPLGRRRQAQAPYFWSCRSCSLLQWWEKKTTSNKFWAVASWHPRQCCPCQHSVLPPPSHCCGCRERRNGSASQPGGSSGWGKMKPVPPHFPALGHCISQQGTSPSCCVSSWCSKDWGKPLHRAVPSMGKAHLCRVEEEALAPHGFIVISLELFAQTCTVQVFLPLARRKVPAHLPHPDFVGSASSREPP